MMKVNVGKFGSGKFLYLILALSALVNVPARAQQAAYVPFQGQLTDQAGSPLANSAPVTLIFRLYEGPVGGSVLWEEVQPQVTITAGRFSILLGSRTAFQNPRVFRKTVYLGITVDDGDPTTSDVEMRPRQAVVPLIYALNSGDAEKLAGHDWSDILVGGNNDPTKALISSDKVDLRKVIDELRAEVKRDSPPIGSIVAFAGVKEPEGWVLCDGELINLNEKPQMRPLFDVIKNTYGGNGTNTFQLPDLRGRTLIGVGKGDGLTLRRLGERIGHEDHTITKNQLPKEGYELVPNIYYFAGDANAIINPSQNNMMVAGNTHGRPGGEIRVSNPGGGQSMPIIPPSIVVNYIIKYK